MCDFPFGDGSDSRSGSNRFGHPIAYRLARRSETEEAASRDRSRNNSINTVS